MSRRQTGHSKDGGDRVKKKKKATTVFDAMKRRNEEKRSDVSEGKLAKRENSPGQNGEDF
jgi:hypothetical protein